MRGIWYWIHMEREREGWLMVLYKVVLYLVAATLFLRLLATDTALYAAGGGIVLGAALAMVLKGLRLRVWIPLLVSFLVGVLAFGLGDFLLQTDAGPSDVRSSLILADSVFFGLLSFALSLALRSLVQRFPVFSVLEVAFLGNAVAYTFVAHRNARIHRPRWLSDWAWSNGHDPTLILQGIGVVAALLAVGFLARNPKWYKLLSSAVVLLLIAVGVYFFFDELNIEPVVDTGGLDLTSQEQGEDGGGGKGDSGGGSGGGESDSDDSESGESDSGGGGGSGSAFSPPPPPDVIVPVAIATLHDDYEPYNQLFYFRQQVLSYYDGHHLVAASDDFDKDVIDYFPYDETLAVEKAPSPFLVKVPSSVYLLVDHPQPLALSASVSVSPLDNPNPRRFVNAYEVVSMAFNQSFSRLSGRASIPGDWSPEKVAHYLEVPDDPRYYSLSSEIVRDLDPRFLEDPVMKALAIKRYLEVEGFYTRKERHVDDVDPAASFLFGSLRGYCVHFAHSAVYLFRSQGIAARVALGYAVDNRFRAGGATIMIMNDRAHAWPEVHIEGVGWVPLDIYPERSDEPPQRFIDQDLESVLGELARQDETGGKAADPNALPWEPPYRLMLMVALIVPLVLLLLSYGVALLRQLRAGFGQGARAHRAVFVAAIDKLADYGLRRRKGESREAFAERLQRLSPSFEALTQAHLRWAFGPGGASPEQARTQLKAIAKELGQELGMGKRVLAILNPVGWILSR